MNSVILIATLLQCHALLADPNGFVVRAIARFAGGNHFSLIAQSNNSAVTAPAATKATIAGKGAGGVGDSSKPNAHSPVGINLAQVVSYSRELPFVDVVKTAHPWFSNTEGADWSKGGPLPLTREGWVASLRPKQYATTGLIDNGGHYPTGNYTLLYDGEGQLEVSAMSGKGVTLVSQAPGRSVVTVTTEAEGALLTLRATNPANPVRNIHFILPGHEKTYQTQPFNPQFLKALSPFKVLRFMDWQETNGSQFANWADRTTPTSATQAVPNGVALEYMIQLANTLKADPWFTIPIRANDDFVRQFATLVRDRLDPSLKVHIEYSNEVWNYSFEQAEYAGQQGLKQGLDKDKYAAGAKYYAQRSVEIFNIWTTVFKGNDRLIRDLAWQAVNPDWAETVLSYKDAYKHADEYAIAPYFNGGSFGEATNLEQSLKATPDQIIEAMRQNIRQLNEYVVADSKLTKKYGLRLVAYEGGQDLSAHWVPAEKEKPLNDLFLAASRSPRMRDLYNEYLNQWKASGGGLLNQYNDVSAYLKWGHWGLLEYQDQPLNASPKYQGVMDFIKANPTK